MHRSPRKGLTKRVMAFDMLQYLLSVTCLQQLAGLARNCRSTRYICGSKRPPSSKAFLSYLLCSLCDNACQEGKNTSRPVRVGLHAIIAAYVHIEETPLRSRGYMRYVCAMGAVPGAAHQAGMAGIHIVDTDTVLQSRACQ